MLACWDHCSLCEVKEYKETNNSINDMFALESAE
jgi:hypothetical protein